MTGKLLLHIGKHLREARLQSQLIFLNLNFQSLLAMNGKKIKNSSSNNIQKFEFLSLCELGKTWKYSLSPRFKSPNFESIGILGKVMS